MSRTMTAQDRSSLIRLASSLPAGSPERADILFIVEHARPVRLASSGRVVYAFSFSSIASDFWSFLGKLADKVMEFADLMEKVELKPEAVQKINRACEEAVKALDKAMAKGKAVSSKQASHKKDANLIGVAAMGAALKRTANSAPSYDARQEAIVLYMLAVAFFPLVAAFGVIWAVYGSYSYYVNEVDNDLHAALRKKAKDMLEYAKGKDGFMQKLVRFLSKFVHSDPTPDPFGEMGAAFELYGLWYWAEDTENWRESNDRRDDEKFAHPFGKVSVQEADELYDSGSFKDAIVALQANVRGRKVNNANLWWGNSRSAPVNFVMKDVKGGTWWARGKDGWFQYPSSEAKALIKNVRKVPNF